MVLGQGVLIIARRKVLIVLFPATPSPEECIYKLKYLCAILNAFLILYLPSKIHTKKQAT